MWKYRCKSHLITLLVAFLGGLLLTVLTFNTSLELYNQLYPEEVIEYMVSHKELVYVLGGMSIAGFFNLILLAQWIMTQFSINPIIIMLVVFLIPDQLFFVGTLLVVPMVIVCIYGMLTLKSSTSKAFSKAKISEESELLRLYKLHHNFREDVKPIAEMVKKNEMRISGIFALGVVAIICVSVLISNFWIMVLAFIFYMVAFNIILRYRASAIIPITALLYEQCDPEACASAIFFYSQNRRNKIKLKQHTLLAQCLIYLDDPELAQDVLITYERKDAASSLQYWTLMAYIDYLLKDEYSLQRCKEEASNIQLHFGKTGVMIQNDEVKAIQNKIDLMNGELNICRKYYLEALRKARFPFQKVDACYYIGLISFVEQDYPLANVYFTRVVQQGNKMCFVERAKKYLEKIQGMDVDLNSVYES